MARPNIKVDPAKLKALMRLKPRLKDTAAFFECSVSTIQRFIRKEFNLSFIEFREQNTAQLSLVPNHQSSSGAEVILLGDCLERLREMPDKHIQTCITSPPYWGLRDYGVFGQLGLEKTPDEYVAKMVEVFGEVRRVLKDDGTLWLNLGDSYAQGGSGGASAKSGLNHGKGVKQTDKFAEIQAKSFARKAPEGLKPKDLVGIPWRVAFALQADGWYLRQDIIWHKPNPMPESVRDRCTKAHEYIFLLSKQPQYYFDHAAIKEPAVDKKGCGNTRQPRQVPGHADGTLRSNLHKIPIRDTRNKRSVWTVTTKPFKGAHFATFPPDLIEPCILAGSAFGDYVLDPFAGAGTVGVVCKKHGRKFIGIELNAEYFEIAEKRIANQK